MVVVVLLMQTTKRAHLPPPSKAIITVIVGQTYKRSKGVKGESSDIDNSFTCLLGRKKRND